MGGRRSPALRAGPARACSRRSRGTRRERSRDRPVRGSDTITATSLRRAPPLGARKKGCGPDGGAGRRPGIHGPSRYVRAAHAALLDVRPARRAEAAHSAADAAYVRHRGRHVAIAAGRDRPALDASPAGRDACGTMKVLLWTGMRGDSVSGPVPGRRAAAVAARLRAPNAGWGGRSAPLRQVNTPAPLNINHDDVGRPRFPAKSAIFSAVDVGGVDGRPRWPIPSRRPSQADTTAGDPRPARRPHRRLGDHPAHARSTRARPDAR